MNRKRAFTLIELLVVIAIIAILAAILFPVFAQAKLAAKKAASISNVKQITLANIMYENDYDDNFVLSTQGFLDMQCGLSGYTGSFCANNLPAPQLGWVSLLQPYIKTLGLYVDPGTGDPNGIFGSGPNSIVQNWGLDAQYEYNYLFLSPWPLYGLTGGGVLPSGYLTDIFGLGRSSTAAVNPAGTVMFTASQSEPILTDGTGGESAANGYSAAHDHSFATPPGVGHNIIAAPDRLIWTPGCVGAFWICFWTGITPQGPITSNVRTSNPYQGSVTGFVDGHAKSMSAGQLAGGTDWGNSTTSEAPYGGTGTGSVVTNINAFMWTLDGTLNDVN